MILKRLPVVASFIVCACFYCSCCCTAETHIKWSPNENDQNTEGGSSGPLPLSMNQRQQLLQLEQAIAESPHPQESLERVAQANQMSPQDLLAMLQRNRADLQQSGGNADVSSSTISLSRSRSVLVQLISTLLMFLSHTAKSHPRWLGVVTLSVLMSLYVHVNISRNGIILSSSQRSLFSRGPTTFWQPPAEYIEKTFFEKHQHRWKVLDTSAQKHPITAVKFVHDLLLFHDFTDSFIWLDRKTLKRASVRHAAMGQSTVLLEDLISPATTPLIHRLQSTTDHNESDSILLRDTVVNIALDHASDLFRSQHLTEFCQDRLQYRRLYKNQSNNKGVLVVPGMGDWGRVGLLPVLVPEPQKTATLDDEEEKPHLALVTLPGYHWEGEIHIVASIDRKSGGEDAVLQVRVVLVIPSTSQHSISQSIARNIVTTLSDSIATSIKTRTKQSLSRLRQSSSFQREAKVTAGVRRRSRRQKERDLEEMAADRRRRWQRQNPNAGHYRPSGDRMRSPNNAVYR